MMKTDDDVYAYWMGYMLSTVKEIARRSKDRTCVDALRVFCDSSSLVTDSDREALEAALSGDDPLYQGNLDDAKESARLEARDAEFSRKVPDTFRLVGAFCCEPDPSCGQDAA